MSSEKLQAGTLLNQRYSILKAIGRGGMGTVYQAEHVQLDTLLAVKEIHAPADSNADLKLALEQCQQEARFLVHLNHPNLPKVTDAFLENDRFYLVMEYIEGVTLESKLKSNAGFPLDAAQVVSWGIQIADVLCYLHSQDPPIIFRDLKPSNVMLCKNNHIYLIDFGIARRFQPGSSRDTQMLGSVGYSPPEQFGKHQTDARSDIYSLGATLHHLLTGRDPSHAPFKFTPARILNPIVPDDLSRLLDQCLHLDADARPRTMKMVADDLAAIQSLLPLALDGRASENPTVASAGIPSAGVPTQPATGSKIIMTRSVGGSNRISSSSAKIDRFTTSSGSLSSSSNAMRIIVSAVLLLVAGGFGYYFWGMGHPNLAKSNNPGQRTQPGIATQSGDVNPPTGQPNQVNTNPDPGKPNTAITSPAQHPISAAFRTFSPPSVTTNEQGASILRLGVKGQIDGLIGSKLTIASFFYDGQNQPMRPREPKSIFTSQSGQLSVAAPLDVTADNQAFELNLDLPLSALPDNAVAGGIKYRCVIFLGDKRLVESEMFTVSPALFPTQPTQPPDMLRDPNSNPTQPANSGGSGTNPQPNTSNGPNSQPNSGVGGSSIKTGN